MRGWYVATATSSFPGYEVFRFGAAELEQHDAIEELPPEFFTTLFREFKVAPT